MNPIQRWIERNVFPVMCVVCHRRMASDEAEYLRTTTGQTVPFCPEHYQEQVSPFSKAAQK